MGRRAWLNLVLLVVVVALAALAYLQPGREPEAPPRLTELNSAEVQRVTLRRAEGARLVLQRRDRDWYLAEPVEVAARGFQVTRLLDMLNLESLQRFPVVASELPKYGLQSPRARLKADGVELAFGGLNPLNGRRYVRVDDMIHMVAQDDSALLTSDWWAFVATAPLPDEPLQRLALPGLGVIERAADGWHYTGERPPASADQLQALVDAWRHAQALQVRPLDSGDSAGVVEIDLASGIEMRLALRRGEGEVVLQRRDLGLEYVFDAAQGQRLFEWPEVAGGEYEQGTQGEEV